MGGMSTIFDVAAAIEERLGPLDEATLQAMLYLVQGWSLAWTGEAMFDDEAVWVECGAECGVCHT